MTTNLQPCPFCGTTTKDTLLYWNEEKPGLGLCSFESDEGVRHHVLCRHCGATGPAGVDRKDAVELWNIQKLEKS